MNSEAHVSNRETAIDALRGTAVLGMIVAHAIFFFHTSADPHLLAIASFANTVVMTLFVFVSGAAASRSLDKYAHIPFGHRAARILKYVGFLYLGYILVGITGVLTTKPSIANTLLAERLIGVLTLTNPINFTEYVPLFIILPVLSIFLAHLYRSTRSSLTVTIMVGIVAYTIGAVLYPMQFSGVANVIKILFAGDTEVLRFPILFYFPVYLIGLWWEHNIEHPGFSRALEYKHVLLLVGSMVITTLSFALTGLFDIPLLAPQTRWPPSIGFLSVGVTSAMLFIFWETVLPKPTWISHSYKFIVYLGRDAYDLWITHLLLLFAWRYFVGIQFDKIETVLFLFLLYGIATIYFSSLTVINAVTYNHFGRVAIAPVESRRFRKRYSLIGILIGVLLFVTLYFSPTQTLYGNTMTREALSVFDRITHTTHITIQIDKSWYIRRGEFASPIGITLHVIDAATRLPQAINPDIITIHVDGKKIQLQHTTLSRGVFTYELIPSDFGAGNHTIFASIQDGSLSLQSNSTSVILTEPLLVAWTLDWEGWDAQESALTTLDNLAESYQIPYTHFINPRTFITQALPEDRKARLRSYLLDRLQRGDESALHVHMQYDLVEASGVIPVQSPHWGLRTREGYDIPSTAYTNEQFHKIVTYARLVLTNQGFPTPLGYRAGGWFMNTGQLQVLSDLGFSYDASGREKPNLGAFRTIPWDLPLGAQPYFPYPDNQNIASPTEGKLLEIPGLGSTYELDSDELIERIGQVYSNGYLDTPKALVFVSHPQFSAREFPKIPAVLHFLYNKSIARNVGPVIFTKVSSIHSLWTSGL